MPPSTPLLKYLVASIVAVLCLLFYIGPIFADPATDMESKVKTWATECQTEVATQMELLVSSGRLSMEQMFDTFYVPIPNTTPQKFRTQYDTLSDQTIQQIQTTLQ
ncbi:MAG: hypothetical protein HZB87_09265 [Desulfatitalea sp.]|nr:hypothetical protein [Desulfatitalea sp.]